MKPSLHLGIIPKLLSIHSSSAHVALRCVFFTSMNVSFTSFWPCSRLFSSILQRVQTMLSFASSAGIAANKSSLGLLRLGLKSRSTSRHLANSRPSSSFFTVSIIQLEDTQRLDHSVHLLLRTLSDMLQIQVASLFPK